MVSYGSNLDVYLEELMDLTVRVAMMQTNPDDYVKLDFELLRIELREFEALVSQLRDSLNTSSPALDTLFTEVRPSSRDRCSLFVCEVLIVSVCSRFTT